MKRKTLVATFVAGAAMLAPSAFGQTYVGAGYTYLEADATGDDVSVGAITGRVGYELNPFFAVEGEVSFGIDDGEYSLGVSTVETKLEHSEGVFAVGKLPLPMFGTLFARGGYANLSFDDPGNSIDDGAGLTYGGGIEFDVLPGVKTRLEYTDYGSNNVKSFGLSGQIKF